MISPARVKTVIRQTDCEGVGPQNIWSVLAALPTSSGGLSPDSRTLQVISKMVVIWWSRHCVTVKHLSFPLYSKKMLAGETDHWREM